LGSFLIPFIGSPFLHMLMMVILVFAVNFYFKRNYIKIVSTPVKKEPFSLKLFKPLFLLGLIGFISPKYFMGQVFWHFRSP